MGVVRFVEMIIEVAKDDLISRKEVAMFEKISKLFKEELARLFFRFGGGR